MAAICVAVDNGHLETLLVISEGASGTLALTTLNSGQDSAIIEVSTTDRSHSEKLYTLRLDKLTIEKPEIDVRGLIRSGVLHLEFDLEGKTCHRKTIRLRGRNTRRRWALIPLLLVLAIGLFFVQNRGPEQPESVNPVPETRILAEPQPEPAPIAGTSPRGEIPSADTEPLAPFSEQPEMPILLEQSVYFLPDSAHLTTEAKIILDDLMSRLTMDEDLSINGHCALAGTEQGRVGLSKQRANSVYSYFLLRGWPTANEPVLKGLGGSDPITLEPGLQHLNRRVDILLSRMAAER